MMGANNNLLRLGWIAAAMAAVCAVAWAVKLHMELSHPAYTGKAIDVDFAVFWAAAKLTLAEGPLIPFDVARLNEARALPPGQPTFPMLWLYPPGWLTVLLPLGYLSFYWAWLTFGLVSAALFGAALWRPARDVPGAWPLIMAAPATLMTLALGQNSLIFAGLLVFALEAIRRDQAVLAGLIIAVMTLKPQLGLAIPVALLAAGQWRVILWATVGTAVILAASVAWPGIDYWPAFFHGLADGSERIRESGLPSTMLSAYGTGIELGLDRDTALNVQLVFSLCAAGALAWLWASRAAFDLKAAGLAFGVLLVTPYAIYYEGVFALVACLYLARGGAIHGRLRAALPIIVWLIPIIGFAIVAGPGFFFCAPLMALGLGLAIARGRGQSALTERAGAGLTR